MRGWTLERRRRQVVALGAGWLLVLAAPVAQAGGGERLKVAVSILPQVEFVERIGGAHVEVTALVGSGQSPHLYQATPKQVTEVGAAQVYFSIGVDCETALLPRLRRMFPSLKFVDTRAGVPLRAVAAGHECEHEHEAHDGHEHAAEGAATQPAEAGGRPDPHIWLSPRLVKIQAETMCKALCELDPPHADEYRRNLVAFQAELDRVHDRIAEVLAPVKGQSVLVFHPAFGYFLDEFGLRQVPVEIEGKQPSAKQLVALIGRAKAAGARVIFVQPQFSDKAARAVAEAIGGAVVPLDPLARDYVRNLLDMAEKVRAGLEK